jgi:hypothetical protein
MGCGGAVVESLSDHYTYSYRPDASIEELRFLLETKVLSNITHKDPGISLADVEAQRTRDGHSWTAVVPKHPKGGKQMNVMPIGEKRYVQVGGVFEVLSGMTEEYLTLIKNGYTFKVPIGLTKEVPGPPPEVEFGVGTIVLDKDNQAWQCRGLNAWQVAGDSIVYSFQSLWEAQGPLRLLYTTDIPQDCGE